MRGSRLTLKPQIITGFEVWGLHSGLESNYWELRVTPAVSPQGNETLVSAVSHKGKWRLQSQQLQESGVYQEPDGAGMWVLDRASRQEPRILMPALGDFKQRVDAGQLHCWPIQPWANKCIFFCRHWAANTATRANRAASRCTALEMHHVHSLETVGDGKWADLHRFGEQCSDWLLKIKAKKNTCKHCILPGKFCFSQEYGRAILKLLHMHTRDETSK